MTILSPSIDVSICVIDKSLGLELVTEGEAVRSSSSIDTEVESEVDGGVHDKGLRLE